MRSTSAFDRLPEVMRAATPWPTVSIEPRSTSPRRSCSQGREGDVFDAVVTDEDERGVRVQIGDPAVVARVAAHRVDPGDPLRVSTSSPLDVRRDDASSSNASG